MRVGEAREAASRWVMLYGRREQDFGGAFFTGSTISLQDNEELPPVSDVNVVVVVGRDSPPARLGRFLYRDVLLDVRYVSWSQLASAEAVLSSYRLASCFRHDTIIDDPTGALTDIYDEVSNRFDRRPWPQRRGEEVRRQLDRELRTFDEKAPFPQQVAAWVAASGVAAHVPLAAALRDPEGRRSFVVARRVLYDFDHDETYRELLELLGYVHLARKRVEHHLWALVDTFDAAAGLARGQTYFGTEVSAATRRIVIDGSLDLIEKGYHREAMYWILSGFAQSHLVLAADAPRATRKEHMPAFESALADLTIDSTDALARRVDGLLRYLPNLWGTAEKILTVNRRLPQKGRRTRR